MAEESTGLRTEGSQSTPELVRDAVDRGSRLIQSEIQLAKAEVAGSLKAAVLAAAGAATAAFALVAFLAMAITAVVIAVDNHWAAALGFAVLFLVIAGCGAAFAVSRIRAISPLRQTVETVKEDVTWAKQQLTRDAR